MLHSLAGLRCLGVDAVAFGDLYLEEIRQYRVVQFAGCGLELLFPLWGLPTRALAEQMIDSGLKARISCVDPRAVPPEWAGREFDRRLLADLPPSADPCAENGEFHTFVYAGPMFTNSIAIKTGETVEREGFVFADLLIDSVPNPGIAAGPAILAG
jgi:diphthamide synthase (EF-2-diphthine--ammonia ligase)